jgi:hypothetical protein
MVAAQQNVSCNRFALKQKKGFFSSVEAKQTLLARTSERIRHERNGKTDRAPGRPLPGSVCEFGIRKFAAVLS